MHCSLPESSVEFSRQEYWSGLPFAFPWGSSQPRNWTLVSCIKGTFFTVWATRENSRRLKKLVWNSTLKKLASWHPIPLLHGKYRGKSGSSDRFYFLGLQKSLWTMTVAIKVKRCLFLRRKVKTKLDSLLKNRDIICQQRSIQSKLWFFPVVIYGCASCTIKKTECQRIDAFELWWWRRLLKVPWTERRSNQSILKKINPEYLLEGLMLKLKFQYFGRLTQRWSTH